MASILGNAVMRLCELFDEGDLAAHVPELAGEVAKARGALSELPSDDLRQRYEAWAARWNAEAIRADTGTFCDETQVLAAELGDTDLLDG